MAWGIGLLFVSPAFVGGYYAIDMSGILRVGVVLVAAAWILIVYSATRDTVCEAGEKS